MARNFTRSRPKQGERLLQFRLAAGFSQKELADLIGETQQNIAFWEQAEKPPRSDTLPKLAKVLGVSVEDILNGEGTSPKKSGPTGKLQTLFEKASQLPRSQQEKLMDFITAFVSHYQQNKEQKTT
ncbi:MAG: helix-turn-helix transcriptional regulator [Candidatus Riflebacteria bacterium]|nr:helix-turn-helix transcriptional regulator [Candidatus Riflebacteria bacterium]